MAYHILKSGVDVKAVFFELKRSIFPSKKKVKQYISSFI